jgi:hypothetical protein
MERMKTYRKKINPRILIVYPRMVFGVREKTQPPFFGPGFDDAVNYNLPTIFLANFDGK